MDEIFTYLVRALRNADIHVSPAETIDAMVVLNTVGIEDPILLKDSLRLVLAKTVEEKRKFEIAFDSFFSQFAFEAPLKRSMYGQLDRDSIMQAFDEGLPPRLHAAIDAAIQGNRTLLSKMVQEAAQQIRVSDISSLREKSTYALQIKELLELQRLDDSLEQAEVTPFHQYLRQYIRNEINSYIENQYKLHVDPTGKKSFLQATLKGNLASIPNDYLTDVRKVVEKLGERLVKERKRQRRTNHVGVLDIKKTMRKNMAFDGAIFDLSWRKQKKEVGTVYVLCDVSQSVARVARFLLLLLFELVQVLPKVRAFAFSSVLGEVTEVFQTKSTDAAIEDALFTWGKGNTDYGRAFHDFRDLCGSEINRRSTIVVLGDARSNFYDPGTEVLREISTRSKQLYWLNPETQDQWLEGDSEMQKFAPFCRDVRICNRITHLERFAEELLRVSR